MAPRWMATSEAAAHSLERANPGSIVWCMVLLDLQIAKALGASKVIATAGTDAKCEIAKRIGARPRMRASQHVALHLFSDDGRDGRGGRTRQAAPTTRSTTPPPTGRPRSRRSRTALAWTLSTVREQLPNCRTPGIILWRADTTLRSDRAMHGIVL